MVKNHAKNFSFALNKSIHSGGINFNLIRLKICTQYHDNLLLYLLKSYNDMILKTWVTPLIICRCALF